MFRLSSLFDTPVLWPMGMNAEALSNSGPLQFNL
jgi:hypothetical protein